MSWTNDPVEAFKAFLDGKKVSYCRPNIDWGWNYEYDENRCREEIQENYFHEITEYSSLFIFLNKEATTNEDATIYQIEEFKK
jgi:hypothetical protein